MKNQITIEQLAEKMNQTVWSKGDLKRIYLNDAGWNTKKMSTKTFIFQDENGNFKVSCRIECLSQTYQWIESQEKEVKDGVYSSLEKLLWEIENPEGDWYEMKENEETEMKSKRIQEEKNIKEIKREEKVNELNKKELEHWERELSYVEDCLKGKDSYIPSMPRVEKIFLQGYRQIKDGNFFEEMPDDLSILNTCIFENGNYKKIKFPDTKIEWRFERKCGGKHKKNIFVPVEIPAEIQEILNASLKEAEDYRIVHLTKRKEKALLKLKELSL